MGSQAQYICSLSGLACLKKSGQFQNHKARTIREFRSPSHPVQMAQQLVRKIRKEGEPAGYPDVASTKNAMI